MFHCPICKRPVRMPVLKTVTTQDGQIVRRRQCPNCRHDYRTIEKMTGSGLRVRKSTGAVVPFDESSIRESISEASSRLYPEEKLDVLVSSVITVMQGLDTPLPIPSSTIAQAVLHHLKQHDRAIHIRFALVHAGRKDRSDGSRGWENADDVRQWLVKEYTELEHYRAATRLTTVVKENRRDPEDFNRKKLVDGIVIAAKGRGRSERKVHELAQKVADAVERELGDQPRVTSGQIAAEIMRILRNLDDIAYLRYASTAKGYSSPQDYEDEALALTRQRPRKRNPRGVASDSSSSKSQPDTRPRSRPIDAEERATRG